MVGVAGDIKETNPFDEMHWKVQPHAYLPLVQGKDEVGASGPWSCEPLPAGSIRSIARAILWFQRCAMR